MKKMIVGVLASIALLTGCAGTDTTTAGTSTAATGTSILGDVGTTLFTQTVDGMCRSQLNAQAMYKTATSFMTADQKTALENNVCGCVSSEAPNSVSMSELGQAVTNSTARTQIAGKVLTKTLGTCVQKMLGVQ